MCCHFLLSACFPNFRHRLTSLASCLWPGYLAILSAHQSSVSRNASPAHCSLATLQSHWPIWKCVIFRKFILCVLDFWFWGPPPPICLILVCALLYSAPSFGVAGPKRIWALPGPKGIINFCLLGWKVSADLQWLLELWILLMLGPWNYF